VHGRAASSARQGLAAPPRTVSISAAFSAASRCWSAADCFACDAIRDATQGGAWPARTHTATHRRARAAHCAPRLPTALSVATNSAWASGRTSSCSDALRRSSAALAARASSSACCRSCTSSSRSDVCWLKARRAIAMAASSCACGRGGNAATSCGVSDATIMLPTFGASWTTATARSLIDLELSRGRTQICVSFMTRFQAQVHLLASTYQNPALQGAGGGAVRTAPDTHGRTAAAQRPRNPRSLLWVVFIRTIQRADRCCFVTGRRGRHPRRRAGAVTQTPSAATPCSGS
jgi:hypothetical protein